MTNLALKDRHSKRHTKDSKKNLRVPSLRWHKASGRAYVVLNGKAVYLGPYDDPVVKRNYQQAIAEWLAAGRQLPAEPNTITVKELLARFWIHAEQYYQTTTDGRVKELEQFRLAMRPMKKLYADTRAIDFGPRALKALRQHMIAMGWCRPYVNKQLNRIRHIFKWAVSQELIPSAVLYTLQAVAGLRRGRSEAPEPEPVKPVSQDCIDAIEPYVSRQIWALIQLQLLTAARPSELLIIRPCDIDCTSNIWVYKPPQHKTAHHGYERKIYIGPRGQQILAPFLLRSPEACCFSPIEAEEERRAEAHAKRKTPLSCGNKPGTNRKANPTRKASEFYTVDSYRRAIARACDQAFAPPEPLDEEALKAWQKAHLWHPHQLRHNAATSLRKEFGLEAARIILGHRSAAITEVYAELDQQKAIEAMAKIG